MNAEYIKEKSMYRCKECGKFHANYRWASDCCSPRIRLINHMTGEEVNLAFGVKRLGYSNECVICDAFGYDEGKMSDSNNSEAWEIISIDGWSPTSQTQAVPSEQSPNRNLIQSANADLPYRELNSDIKRNRLRQLKKLSPTEETR